MLAGTASEAMRSQVSVRSAEQLTVALVARQETLALLLGEAAHKLIRSQRALVATKVQLAALRRNCEKNPGIG